MIKGFKKAVVIGETSICIQCTRHLIKNGWKISLVVSNDKLVIDWGKNNDILIFSTMQLDEIKEKNFYLFSIVNPYLIPDDFLNERNVILALNYHDSFLPKYAGVNSTTWAILNNEKKHGVTIHQIKPGIDEGDIVAQSVVGIDENETAISLNLKCSERLLTLFQDVAAKIEDDTLNFIKQNLADKTYYGYKDFPANYAIINGIENLETIYRLIRALTFGDGYANQIATVKLFLNDRFYIAENFNMGVLQEGYNVDDKTILFHTLKDIYGNKTGKNVSYKDISRAYDLSNECLEYISNIKKVERRHRRSIAGFLESAGASMEVFDSVFSVSTDIKYERKIALPEYTDETRIFVLVYLVLVRFFYNKFIISLYDSASCEIPEMIKPLVGARNFILGDRGILAHEFSYLEGYLKGSREKCCTLIKDFSYRYGLELLTDVAIIIGEEECVDKHKLAIKIEKNSVKIEGDVVYQMQIDSIAASISSLIFKNIKKDLTKEILENINILDDGQYQQLVYEFNKTEYEYPKDKTIHQCFEVQALKTPENIAVVYKDKKLTYQELNDNANQLANYLYQNCKVEKEDLIVLCMERSEAVLISMLGVLKAGGAYVPINPTHPNIRIEYILEDTKTKVVLTSVNYQKKMQHIVTKLGKNIDIVAIDSKAMQSILFKQSDRSPPVLRASKDLIYVIYTSGTTGKPKGVLVEHRGVVNFIFYMISFAGLNNKSIGSSFASFDFDASVTEIYPILLSGGTLFVVAEEDRVDITKTNDFFNKNNINYAFLPTKFAELFFKLPNTTLENLIVAGDKLSSFSKRRYRVINAYGPTEASVHTTSFIIDKPYNNIPIGKPINNVKCYVVDQNINLQPVGAVGELMIGGESLARGYFNRNDMTEEKFISNPFQTEEEKKQNKNGRLYKTGDLVRLLPEGNLEYIERIDFQVQVRGHRVELGEIEGELANYPDIKQAVVLVKDILVNQIFDRKLIAYYVADKKLVKEEVINYLVTRLPLYMLPSSLVHLTELPVTINGKVDTRVLLELNDESDDSRYVAPNSKQERFICEAFAKVLGIKKVGVKDDFFEMGGNSIQAIHLVSIMQDNFEVSVNDVFNLRTVANLVKKLYFGKNIIRKKLEQVKQCYLNKSNEDFVESKHFQNKVDSYLEGIKKLQKGFFSYKPITNVLLTGSTGFLGCNLLNQLLISTKYNIYLIVRAGSQKAAFDRVNRKFQFYFDKTLNDVYGGRVFILQGDLEDKHLGLFPDEYKNLSKIIDSILHAAALVKHYGDYANFYLQNVHATNNLLDLAKLTNLKDFHYISTSSVLDNNIDKVCTEDDMPKKLAHNSNFYIQTKLEGEYLAIKYRDFGVNSNIYRIGNLAFMSKNCRSQENIEENAFFNWLKFLFRLECIAHDISEIEISPADLTAQAIVKLFDKKHAEKKIYHIFNPYLFNVSKVLHEEGIPLVRALTMDFFIDKIIDGMQHDGVDNGLIMKFLLRHGWTYGCSVEDITPTKILQNRTQHVLSGLGFSWFPISLEVFNRYIKLYKLK